MRLISLFSLTAAIITLSASITPAAVINGDFETGDFSGWTQAGNTEFTGVAENSIFAHSGNHFAFFGNAESLGFLSQFISTNIGQTYQLSYFLKSFYGDLPHRFQLIVNGNILLAQDEIENLDYTHYVNKFVAKTASTELKFGFQSDLDFLLLDDVKFEPVPEPLTLGATVVAGAIGLLMKSRFQKKYFIK
ncbi:hypothetical protein NIES22_17130 [Calothrix brevissima NIES-22]|nr:hypothetical protein NIES22_17130 [Calothrix brevissima NIES-22]